MTPSSLSLVDRGSLVCKLTPNRKVEMRDAGGTGADRSIDQLHHTCTWKSSTRKDSAVPHSFDPDCLSQRRDARQELLAPTTPKMSKSETAKYQ